MKLDDILLKQAAVKKDTWTIIKIFAQHFPDLNYTFGYHWRFMCTDYLYDDSLRLQTACGTFIYKSGLWRRDYTEGDYIIYWSPADADKAPWWSQ